MKALDLSRKVPSVKPSDSLADAARLMLEDHCDCVVIAEEDDVVGVVTESDIVEAVARGAKADAPIVEAVASPPLLVEGYEPLWRVAEAMLSTGIKVAVVTVGGRFAGVISSSDIADERGQLLEASRFAEIAEILAPPG